MEKLSKTERHALDVFFNTISKAANYAQAHFAKDYGNINQNDNEINVDLLASNLKLYYTEHANKQLQQQKVLDISCDYTDFFINEILLSYQSGMRAVGFIIDSAGRLMVDVYYDKSSPLTNKNKGIVKTFFAELGMASPLFIKTLQKVASQDTGNLPIDIIKQPNKLTITYARLLA